MEVVKAQGYEIRIGSLGDTGLEDILTNGDYKTAKKFVLVDENTLKHCFPQLLHHCPSLSSAEVIELESGEKHKNIQVATGLWEALADMEASRHDVIINLGGGVIGDLGGFVATTFKRGMRFINVPTTLLSQVDASVGGKVGVDLNHMKNLVGAINHPDHVFIDGGFLRTLSRNEVLSGLAEIIKHGLVSDLEYWRAITSKQFNALTDFIDLIPESVNIKNRIVTKDPYEQADRKLLNFGHTIGHALEAYSMESELKSLLHGEAISIGMICEAYLSKKKGLISQKDLDEISDFILPWYPKFVLNEMAYHRLIEFMRNDKKNSGGSEINFTLLEKIGKGTVNHTFDIPEIFEALNYYQRLIRS